MQTRGGMQFRKAPAGRVWFKPGTLFSVRPRCKPLILQIGRWLRKEFMKITEETIVEITGGMSFHQTKTFSPRLSLDQQHVFRHPESSFKQPLHWTYGLLLWRASCQSVPAACRGTRGLEISLKSSVSGMFPSWCIWVMSSARQSQMLDKTVAMYSTASKSSFSSS